MSLTPASGFDFQFFFQSKHVMSSICMKTERKGEIALWGRRVVRAGWTRSSGNSPSLSLSLSVTNRFTTSCFSQIQWCLFEERHELKKKKERVRREIECEVKAGLRESFLHAWHLVGWGIGDVTCSGTSLKLRGHGKQITHSARGNCTYCICACPSL